MGKHLWKAGFTIQVGYFVFHYNPQKNYHGFILEIGNKDYTIL